MRRGTAVTVRRFQITDGIVERSATQTAIYRLPVVVVDHYLVPLQHVTPLVERTAGAFGQLVGADLAAPLRAADRVVVSTNPERRVVAIVGIYKIIARYAVATGRVIPISRVSPAALVVGGFVPLVLGRDNPCRIRLALDSQKTRITRGALEVVRTLIDLQRLTVVHPVGKSRRVAPGDEVHRAIGPVVRHAVLVGILRRPTTVVTLDLATVTAQPHACVVQPVGVRTGRRVQEYTVLPRRHFVHADLVIVIHGAADTVRTVSAVALARPLARISFVAHDNGVDLHGGSRRRTGNRDNRDHANRRNCIPHVTHSRFDRLRSNAAHRSTPDRVGKRL